MITVLGHSKSSSNLKSPETLITTTRRLPVLLCGPARHHDCVNDPGQLPRPANRVAIADPGIGRPQVPDHAGIAERGGRPGQVLDSDAAPQQLGHDSFLLRLCLR
jgi:hypothetical protein